MISTRVKPDLFDVLFFILTLYLSVHCGVNTRQAG
jgi:hypothetical protein